MSLRDFGLSPAPGATPSPPSATRAAAPLRPDLARALAYCWIGIAGLFFVLDLYRVTRVGLTDGVDQPLGWDFINYWSGAFLAWRQDVAAVYDWFAFHAFQEKVVGAPIDFFHYSYPPVLLLLSAPLALLPYAPALGAWLVASWYAFYRALRLAAPSHAALLLSLATPAFFVNAVGGQNGAWTAAILGGGLCLLDRRPVAAGILFGLMAYKPHLAILLPVALLAGGRWLTLAATGLTAIALVALSALIFGIDAWTAYAHNVTILRHTVLEDGSGVWHRMLAVFVAARHFGASVPVAYAIQIASGCAAAAVVARAFFRDTPPRARNALFVLCTCLATPYLQDYDLVIGAFVAVWLLSDNGRLVVRERSTVIAVFLFLLMPVATSPLAHLTGLSLAPFFLLPAVVAALRLTAETPHSREIK